MTPAVRTIVLMSGQRYRAQAVHFDGANDSLRLTTNLTGLNDGKTGTLSLWMRITGGDGANRDVVYFGPATGPRLRLRLNSSNKLVMQVLNATPTTILNMLTTPTYLAGGGWLHAISSWDLAAGVRHLYVNDVAPALDTNTLTDDTIDYASTNGRVGIGDNSSGANLYTGDMGEVLFHDTYIDLSVEVNRRKFITAGLKPVNLGADGSVPLGVQPRLFLSGAVEDWQTNKGTGGGLTEVGEITDAGRF